MRTSSQSHSFSVLYFWIFSQHSGIMLGHGHTQRSAPQAHGRHGRWLGGRAPEPVRQELVEKDAAVVVDEHLGGARGARQPTWGAAIARGRARAGGGTGSPTGAQE